MDLSEIVGSKDEHHSSGETERGKETESERCSVSVICLQVLFKKIQQRITLSLSECFPLVLVLLKRQISDCKSRTNFLKGPLPNIGGQKGVTPEWEIGGKTAGRTEVV